MLAGVAREEGRPVRCRCPESEHCLLGADIVDGRIAVHPRNVTGPCPWVDMRVRDLPLACGCAPYITTRQLRIVLRRGGSPNGQPYAIGCPGNCRGLVDIQERLIAGHGRCPWAGALVLDSGLHPPIL
ncbi:hypothetical protein [Nocardia sp. NBC_00416]|uniref:hypothetical protein n=1 Tax=Nocardia sp. NBC_00416 TaxID=2975991 RepID=UPI002E208E46